MIQQVSLIVYPWVIRDKNETYPQTHIYSVIRLVLQHSERKKFIFASGAKIWDCLLLCGYSTIRDT